MMRILCLVLLCCTAGCSERRESGNPVGEIPVATGGTALTPLAAADASAAELTASVENITTEFRFEEIGPESGFDFQRYDDMQGQRRILEVNGGGVAVFDFDRDGWLDVFMTNGCRLPLSTDTRETPGKLFRNLSEMRFRDCSDASGLRQFGFCYGCAVADANEDGFEDLYVTAIGGNQFWLNNGDGTFVEIASQNGTLSGHWGSSAAFADVNGDHFLDLYVANYLDESDTNPRLCPDPQSPDGYVGCSPAIFKGVPDTLFLSDGAGNYIDASVDAGLGNLPGKALGVVICDLGGTSLPEIYVANDGEPNFLLTIELQDALADQVRGVRMRDQAVSANVALNEQGYAQASMGIAAADLDRNGTCDIFLTHFFGDTNTLYLNRSTADTWIFEDGTRSSMLGPPSRSKLGFGVVGLDIDNNGWKDLIVANGHVDDRTWLKASQPWRMTPQVFENQRNGTFRDVSVRAGPCFQKATLGRAVASGDLDRDGRLDVVVSHQLDPSVILRNATPQSGNSLIMRLIGNSGSRTPVGVRVRVLDHSPLLEEQLIGGGSFQAASANEIHVGGLLDQQHDLEVRWPDGEVEVIRGMSPGNWVIRQNRPPITMED